MSICRALDVIGNDSDNDRNVKRRRRHVSQRNRHRAQGSKVLIPIYRRHAWDKKGNCKRCEAKRQVKL